MNFLLLLLIFCAVGSTRLITEIHAAKVQRTIRKEVECPIVHCVKQVWLTVSYCAVSAPGHFHCELFLCHQVTGIYLRNM